MLNQLKEFNQILHKCFLLNIDELISFWRSWVQRSRSHEADLDFHIFGPNSFIICPIFKLFLFKRSGRKAPSHRVHATTTSYLIHEITDHELSIFHVLHIFGPNSFIISPIFEKKISNVQKEKAPSFGVHYRTTNYLIF